jgi:hypothetical protein
MVGPNSTSVVRNGLSNSNWRSLAQLACKCELLELGQRRDLLADHALRFGMCGRPALGHSEASEANDGGRLKTEQPNIGPNRKPRGKGIWLMHSVLSGG